jgi:hypothetical protein
MYIWGKEKWTEKKEMYQNVLSKNHFFLKVFVRNAEFCSGEGLY